VSRFIRQKVHENFVLYAECRNVVDSCCRIGIGPGSPAGGGRGVGHLTAGNGPVPVTDIYPIERLWRDSVLRSVRA